MHGIGGQRQGARIANDHRVADRVAHVIEAVAVEVREQGHRFAGGEGHAVEHCGA